MKLLVQGVRKRSAGLCFLFLAAVTAFLAWRFVYGHWDLVRDSFGFWILVIVLIAVAFLFSSVEAAFSVSARHPGISDAINPDLKKITEEWSSLAARGAEGIDALSPVEQKRRYRLEKKSHEISQRRLILMADGGRRVEIIGSLSALSVVSNTALAAFLPIVVAGSDQTAFSVGPLVFGYDKILILVASALPIIYFGKVVPKTIGLTYPAGFAYRCYPVGNAAFWIVGWMPRGLNWLLAALRITNNN